MVKACIYARVSSELQEKEETIQSQLEALRLYAADKGYQVVAEYVDEGYSGATLARPGLDRLRDALSEGFFDVILIHSPDRLARKAAYQGILLEEFEKHRVGLEFLNHPVDDSPEGRMLLGMQGLFAEYERAKITERVRRGKLYWAKRGALLGGYVPYGYRYVPRSGEQRAHLVVDEDEASVVRQMYGWLIDEGLSCRKIAMRLHSLDIPPSKGGKVWRPSVVGRILKNEAYIGTMYYHRGEAIESPGHKSKKGYRKNTKTMRRIRPQEEWIPIPVPPIIDRATWELAQEQLHENFLHSPRNNRRYSYLLRGLVKCSACGFNYVGAAYHNRRYYRCCNKDAFVASEGNCRAPSIWADSLEEVVWQAISQVLQQPDILAQEYQRRLAEATGSDVLEAEQKQLSLALKRLKSQEDRLIDAYKNEAIELSQLKEEMQRLKARRQDLERQQEVLERRSGEQASLRESLAQLKAFCQRVSKGLEELTFEEKQKLLRLLVDRITVDGQHVQIQAVIPIGSPADFANLRPCSVLGTSRRRPLHLCPAQGAQGLCLPQQPHCGQGVRRRSGERPFYR